MKKKIPTLMVVLAVLLTLVLCVMPLAGCGGGDESGDSSGNGSAGTTGTAGGDAAQAASCQANLRSINSAISQYKAENGKNPSSINDLVPNYLRSIPKEPTGGTYSISGGKAVCSKGHTI